MILHCCSLVDEERVQVVSVSLDNVVDRVTARLHVACLPDIIEQKEKLIHVFMCSLSPVSIGHVLLSLLDYNYVLKVELMLKFLTSTNSLDSENVGFFFC